MFIVEKSFFSKTLSKLNIKTIPDRKNRLLTSTEELQNFGLNISRWNLENLMNSGRGGWIPPPHPPVANRFKILIKLGLFCKAFTILNYISMTIATLGG